MLEAFFKAAQVPYELAKSLTALIEGDQEAVLAVVVRPPHAGDGPDSHSLLIIGSDGRRELGVHTEDDGSVRITETRHGPLSECFPITLERRVDSETGRVMDPHAVSLRDPTGGDARIEIGAYTSDERRALIDALENLRRLG